MRQVFLPYGRQTITDEDVDAVTHTLQSDYLTTGPEIAKFENELSAASDTTDAVTVSSGTAALHAMYAACGIGAGDEVIVPVITFAATANAAQYLGASAVFADVDASTLLMDPVDVERRITSRTKAIVPVDFAGQPANYEAIKELCADRDIHFLVDAAHSIGATRNGTTAAAIPEASTFSFHPVKHVAAGEGGAVVTSDAEIAQRVRAFRNHGISADHTQRHATGTWEYDIPNLGFNYRMSDIHCALGRSQLSRLAENINRRTQIANFYDREFASVAGVTPLAELPGSKSSHHIYVIQLDESQFTAGRAGFFEALRAENIGVNVHYMPVPWHSYYRARGHSRGQWPKGEAAYARMLTVPLWAGMNDSDANDVVIAVKKVSEAYRR